MKKNKQANTSKSTAAAKPTLHPRNPFRKRYDLEALSKSSPGLVPHIKPNKYGGLTLDFSNPEAVKMLNSALLMHQYQIDFWEIPTGYLCPPIPGRTDYLLYAADLLAETNKGIIPQGPKIKCLDVGVGANCIYPIIGVQEYDWAFTGSDIDPIAIKAATGIVENNPALKNKVELRLQKNLRSIFKDIIQKDEHFDLVICNPPFHKSLAAATSGTIRKIKNLSSKKPGNSPAKKVEPVLNFGGQNTELWYPGGEVGFIKNMIEQSVNYADSCLWFTTLVSKKAHLEIIHQFLKKTNAKVVKTIPMGQGNKISRLIAWSFLNKPKQELWVKERW